MQRRVKHGQDKKKQDVEVKYKGHKMADLL